MAICALKANLEAQGNYTIVQLHEIGIQLFYISNSTQHTKKWSISEFKLF